MSTEKNPKQFGVEAGYYYPATVPPCPYPLWDRDTEGKKVRNQDRDDWLTGYSLGKKLRERHNEELEKVRNHDG